MAIIVRSHLFIHTTLLQMHHFAYLCIKEGILQVYALRKEVHKFRKDLSFDR